MREFIGCDVTTLIKEYATRIEELGLLYSELAFHKSEELRAKSHAWESFPNESQTYRDKAGSVAATNNTIMVMEVEGRIKSLTDEKFFLKLLIDHAASF